MIWPHVPSALSLDALKMDEFVLPERRTLIFFPELSIETHVLKLVVYKDMVGHF